jgi:hypothetical protein
VGYDLPQVFDYLRQQLSVPLIITAFCAASTPLCNS